MATNYGANIRLTAQDTTAAALASLRKNLGDISKEAVSLRGVFGALVPTVTVAGAALFLKNINDGVDALNDFKDATGSSIENASALEDIAARTGTSFDTVTTSVIKFNQALAEAKPDSDISKALQSIGLEAEKLKGLDPAEALRQTSVALSKYADDGKRARLVQELFGKSVKEVAPFLNDLAKQTELVATVTTQQAEAAEEFNKQLFELQKNAKDAGRSLTADLVTGLNLAAKAYKEGGFVDGLRGLFGGDDEFKASKTLVEDTEKLLNLENALAAARAQGVPEQGRIVQNLVAQKKQTEENIRLAQNYLKVLRGETSLTGAPAAGSVAAPSVDFDPDRDKRAKEANDKRLKEAKKLASDIEAEWRKVFADGQSVFDSVLTPAEKLSSEMERLDGLISAGAIDWETYERAAKKAQDGVAGVGDAFDKMRASAFQDGQSVFESVLTPAEKLASEMDRLDGLLAQGAISWETYSRAAQKANETFDESEKKTKEVGNAARELGFTFSSAFEDAVVGGKKTREILQGILDDIARITLRKNVTEPFAEAVGNINWGEIFTQNAKGGVYGSTSLSNYSNGVYDSPQVFAFAKGMGIFAEAGAEAIMPLTRTASGDLGVRAIADSGGAGNVIVNVIEAPGRGGQQTTRQEGGSTVIDVMVEQIKTAVAGDIMRGSGVIPDALSHSYGLNRAAGAY
jgi:hypothetical protein